MKYEIVPEYHVSGESLNLVASTERHEHIQDLQVPFTSNTGQAEHHLRPFCW